MAKNESKTEEIYKTVRGIVNRFDMLLSYVQELEIDTEEKLQGVVELLFEKAVYEPKFTDACALMCKELVLTHVPVTSSTEDKEVQFNSLLIKRCQLEFEKQSRCETIKKDKIKELSKCVDLEKKKKLEHELEEYEYQLRIKSAGIIRFLGELFNRQVLTTSFMMKCLHMCLENRNNESLECLCALLSIIGKEIERVGETDTSDKSVDLNFIFNAMKDIVGEKHENISSRIIFMLQDVIDLRKNKWLPRQQDLNLKTVNKKQNTENEQPIMQALSSTPMTPKKGCQGSTASAANSDGIKGNIFDHEKPKSVKSFLLQDEIDIAPLRDDKLMQAKSEANANASAENNTLEIIENKSELPYREGQWAPNNLDGKKVYDKDFLLALRNYPVSSRKPDNLLDAIKKGFSDDRYSINNFTTPLFPNYADKSSSQRGPPPKRNNQSGKNSISSQEDVKLHEVENPWRPARFIKSDNKSDDERKTEEIRKKVKGVLNKLTPQKFETLVNQVRELNIDTEERLQGVINLVYEKAVSDIRPNFSIVYALMCREFALMQVPAADSTEEKRKFLQFRKLLVTRCQLEFEKQSYDQTMRIDKLREIDECSDPGKKLELQFELDEYDRRIRMRSVGNIQFIGELFKQQMLTTSIMMRCLDNLLDNKDEESLECLCKLLTIIGKAIERGGAGSVKKGVDLSGIFNDMKDIVFKKYGKISYRIRFMLQDVIDLRKNKWVPRHQPLIPKTIDQIQKEADNEQLNIQAMNSIPMTPRKDDRGSNAASTNSDRKRRNVSDDGWQTTSSRNRTPFTVQSDKLKNKPSQTDEPLGSKQMFGNWSKGSNIKTDAPSATNTANMYAALENIDTEKRPSDSRPNMDAYSSKGPSLERSNYKRSFDGRGSRSGSQHPSAERETSLPTPQKMPPTTIPSASKALMIQVPVVYSMTEEQLERHVKNNLDEYLNDDWTIDEYSQDTQSTVPLTYLPRMVTDGYLHVLERSKTARIRTGILFAKLIKMGTLPLDDYCIGLEEVLSQVDELTIDIPMIWNYLAEILVHLICEEALPLNRLYKSCELIISQGHGSKLLGALFKSVVSEKGPNFLINCWQTSGFSIDNFMIPAQVNSFLRDNKLDFLSGGDTAAGQSQLTYEQIYNKLLEFFSMKTSFDDIVNWITANIGEIVKENKFVRTLVTTIFENSVIRQKLVVDNLKAHYKLLQKYVDNSPNYELQCLYALQALIHKLEHPKGLLLTICNQLYEDAIISQDSFIAWEASDDPVEQEGKDVTLQQLTSFFTTLKENDEDESGTDFHVQMEPYVPQQQPKHQRNQAQTLRGIAPTGSPNQSSTPPTNNLKVQSVLQQQFMNHMYVAPQQQVRGTQGPYYRSGPPSQATRMPSLHRGQEQIYQTQATRYVQMPVPAQFNFQPNPSQTPTVLCEEASGDPVEQEGNNFALRQLTEFLRSFEGSKSSLDET